MTARTRLGIVGALVAGVALCMALTSAGEAPLLLAQLSPAIFMLSVLLLGRYPGEWRLIGGSRGRRVRRVRRSAVAPATGVVRLVRGGELIGRALAGRAPPAWLCMG